MLEIKIHRPKRLRHGKGNNKAGRRGLAGGSL
jgi:hypothetical protein